MITLSRPVRMILIAIPILLSWYVFIGLKFNSFAINSEPLFPTPTPIQLNASKLSSLINEHRQTLGLSPFIEDEKICDIAEERVLEQHNLGELDEHKGFLERYSSYPYVVSENSHEGGYDEKQALRGWLNSPSHRKAVEGNWKYACVATKGTFAVQIFSNLGY